MFNDNLKSNYDSTHEITCNTEVLNLIFVITTMLTF